MHATTSAATPISAESSRREHAVGHERVGARVPVVVPQQHAVAHERRAVDVRGEILRGRREEQHGEPHMPCRSARRSAALAPRTRRRGTGRGAASSAIVRPPPERAPDCSVAVRRRVSRPNGQSPAGPHRAICRSHAPLRERAEDCGAEPESTGVPDDRSPRPLEALRRQARRRRPDASPSARAWSPASSARTAPASRRRCA